MDHDIAHDLERSHARSTARHVLESYAARFAQYRPEVQWTDDDNATVAFTVMGKRLSGGLQVEANRYRLSLNVPLLMRPFSGRAFKVIDEEVFAWLAKARAGEI
jgi:hypothetical protein